MYEVLCVIMEYYFCDEGEIVFGYIIGNLLIIKIGCEGVYQFFMVVFEMFIYDVEIGMDVVLIEDVDVFMCNWEVMIMMGFIKMLWEDYLKLAGVRGREAEDSAKLEFICYVWEWQYLSNMINFFMGVLFSVVFWSMCECVDKDWFFM